MSRPNRCSHPYRRRNGNTQRNRGRYQPTPGGQRQPGIGQTGCHAGTAACGLGRKPSRNPPARPVGALALAQGSTPGTVAAGDCATADTVGCDPAHPPGVGMPRSAVTAGARTAITGWHRAQADISAHELAATTFAAMPKDPEMVMLGNTIGPGGNIARIAALAAGWQSAGAITFDAQCGSGLVAVG